MGFKRLDFGSHFLSKSCDARRNPGDGSSCSARSASILNIKSMIDTPFLLSVVGCALTGHVVNSLATTVYVPCNIYTGLLYIHVFHIPFKTFHVLHFDSCSFSPRYQHQHSLHWSRFMIRPYGPTAIIHTVIFFIISKMMFLGCAIGPACFDTCVDNFIIL
jgi:hypothetical protein